MQINYNISPTVPVPFGYRMLKTGETVKKYDKFRTFDGDWKLADSTIGIRYDTSLGTCFIRRIHRRKTPKFPTSLPAKTFDMPKKISKESMDSWMVGNYVGAVFISFLVSLFGFFFVSAFVSLIMFSLGLLISSITYADYKRFFN